MDEIDALAALLPGRTARRRALVLWRRFVDDPPPTAHALAAELGVTRGTVSNDQITAVVDLKRLDRSGVPIPPDSPLYAAVIGDRERAQTTARRARSAPGN
jgi:hypothetical protein